MYGDSTIALTFLVYLHCTIVSTTFTVLRPPPNKFALRISMNYCHIQSLVVKYSLCLRCILEDKHYIQVLVHFVCTLDVGVNDPYILGFDVQNVCIRRL